MTVFQTLLALATLTAPAVVTAAPVRQTMAVEVSDLDLESDKGQRVLALRIQRAARAMCKAQAVASLPQNLRSERGCIREARASAETAVKTLTAAGERRSGLGG